MPYKIFTPRTITATPRVVPSGRTEYTIASRGIIAIGQHVMLCRGSGENFTHIPGGHVNPGEDPLTALHREIAEETGRSIMRAHLVAETDHDFLRERDGIMEVQHSYIYLVRLAPVINERVQHSKEPWLSYEWWMMSDLRRANLQPRFMVDLIIRHAGA